MPTLRKDLVYRKKCSFCSHMNHFNAKKCKQCGSPLAGRLAGTVMSYLVLSYFVWEDGI